MNHMSISEYEIVCSAGSWDDEEETLGRQTVVHSADIAVAAAARLIQGLSMG